MFSVRLHVDVIGSDGIRTEWTKTITIGFAPWVGLQIRDVSGQRDTHEVTEIEWQLEDNSFVCFCGEEDWDSSVVEVNEEMRHEGWM